MGRLLVFTLRAHTRVFWFNIAGVAAIEFALLAPLLMMMTFGTVEITRALIIHKRFQRATSMVGDLVTRENQLWPKDTTSPDPRDFPANYPEFGPISRETLSGIMTVAVHAMQPYSATPLQIEIYQVWANPSDLTQTKVEWSYGYDWTTSTATRPDCGSTPSFTTDKSVFAASTRAVYIRAQYAFTPLLENLLPDIIRSVTWNDVMVIAPRNVPSVMYLPSLNNGGDWASMDKSACTD